MGWTSTAARETIPAVDARRRTGDREKLVSGLKRASGCALKVSDYRTLGAEGITVANVRLGSIYIRAKAMLRHAGRSFDCEYVLTRQPVSHEPLSNCRLALLNQATKSGLRADFAYRLSQCRI
jgi:hypothetical protein